MRPAPPRRVRFRSLDAAAPTPRDRAAPEARARPPATPEPAARDAEEQESEHEHSQRDDQHGGHARLLPDARRRETVRRDQPRAIGTVAAVSEVVEPSAPSDVEAIVKAVDGQYQEWLATLGELVRIPSVSGDPAHAADGERSAGARGGPPGGAAA